jgi:hypothetical protein
MAAMHAGIASVALIEGGIPLLATLELVIVATYLHMAFCHHVPTCQPCCQDVVRRDRTAAKPEFAPVSEKRVGAKRRPRTKFRL